ncbi:MAG: GNAT family protein [Patescibacteria group bacterium]
MKITFRPIRKTDLKYRFKWLNDPETTEFLGTRTRQGTDFDFHLRWYEKYKTDETRKIFMILYDKKPIGQVGLTHIDQDDKNAELYIAIGEKEFRGKGIGQRAVKFIIDYAFKTLKLHRISLGCFEENVAGLKCYKKCGFVKEGLIREQFYKNGKYCNEVRMGLIAVFRDGC